MIRITIMMITHVYESYKLNIKKLVREMRNAIALAHHYIVTTMGGVITNRPSYNCIVQLLTSTHRHAHIFVTKPLGRNCRYSQLMKPASQKLLNTKFIDTHTDIKIIYIHEETCNSQFMYISFILMVSARKT